jgi:hypothetical protein
MVLQKPINFLPLLHHAMHFKRRFLISHGDDDALNYSALCVEPLVHDLCSPFEHHLRNFASIGRIRHDATSSFPATLKTFPSKLKFVRQQNIRKQFRKLLRVCKNQFFNQNESRNYSKFQSGQR